MRIAVLGTGRVGSSIGQTLARRGHDVMFGARDLGSASVQRLREQLPTAGVVPLSEAVSPSELVILAVPADAIEAIVDEVDLDGKIVIDTTNDIDWSTGAPVLNTTGSQAEKLAARVPGARVVKAFNTLRADHMLDPDFGATPPAIFVCGDDPVACAAAMQLAADMGLQPVMVGPLANAHALEQIAALWIGVAVRDDFGRYAALSVTHRRELRDVPPG